MSMQMQVQKDQKRTVQVEKKQEHSIARKEKALEVVGAINGHKHHGDKHHEAEKQRQAQEQQQEDPERHENIGAIALFGLAGAVLMGAAKHAEEFLKNPMFQNNRVHTENAAIGLLALALSPLGAITASGVAAAHKDANYALSENPGLTIAFAELQMPHLNKAAVLANMKKGLEQAFA